MAVGVGEFGREGEIERDTDQRHRHRIGKQRGVDALDRERSDEGANERGHDRRQQVGQRDETAAPVSRRCYGGADHRLHLVGAEGGDGRDARRE
jgi:hypothetical protein